MRVTKSKIIIVMCILLCIMVVVYSAFNAALTITGTANIASEWKVVFSKIEEVSKTSGVIIKSAPSASGTSATFDVGLTNPGDEIEYKITIENQGTIDAKVQKIDISETDSTAIIFGISGIQVDEQIKAKTTKTFNVTIEYDSTVTSQPDKTDKVLTLNITTVQSTGGSSTPSEPSVEQLLLSNTILKDNVEYADNVSSKYVSASTGIDFSQISSDTNGKGLYYTSTNTENNQKTYYFRGAVDNNNVQFGKYKAGTTINGTTYSVDTPIYWKIIRINEDGSIRLLYNGTSAATTGADKIIANSIFNTKSDDNAYVGYMYGAAGQSGTNGYNLTHKNDNPSVAKNVLDEWYENNLGGYSSYLVDAGFCNDRSKASSAGLWYSQDTALGYAKKYTVYGAAGRLANINDFIPKVNAQPQFKCPNEARDLFTTGTSSKGNNELTYPIGLITMDEVAYAGGILDKANTSMYLTSGNDFWTMSPFRFFGSFAVLWTMCNDGSTYNRNVGINGGVRPVINLRSGVEIISGDGTKGTPYIIK